MEPLLYSLDWGHRSDKGNHGQLQISIYKSNLVKEGLQMQMICVLDEMDHFCKDVSKMLV